MSAQPTTAAESATAAGALVSARLPRLLAGSVHERALTLGEHCDVHGGLPLESRRGRRLRGRHDEAALIAEVDRAGLLGRGGAAFPTARKMRAVAGARGHAIVLVNGAEGEPASLKDHTLMELVPHLVLDGAVAAAEALGADEVVVAACEFAGHGLDGTARAIEERERDGVRGPRIELVVVPGHYVAGQETALVNYVGGGPAKPLFTPPMVFEQGVRRRPTLVSNVETYAHLALIARHGAAWFREVGVPSQPGSALVTLSGPVAHPGVYEIEQGASLASLIAAAGGTTARPSAALIGGYSGTWIDAAHLHGVALCDEHLAPHGARLGAGVVLLLSEHACPVAETARLARWLADQSAHQCGPCIHGLDALADTIAEVAAGRARGAAQRIERLGSLVARRGACAHPDGAANVVFSALDAFASEFAEHARAGACDACGRPAELPLPARPVSDARLARRRGSR